MWENSRLYFPPSEFPEICCQVESLKDQFNSVLCNRATLGENGGLEHCVVCPIQDRGESVL